MTDTATDHLAYYDTLAARFDAAAPHYDMQFGPPSGSRPGNRLLTWLREEHLALLRDLLPQDASVLDIGCGTGIEALALVQEGYSVLGIDISPAMVRQAQIKIAAFGIRFGALFKTLPAGQLGALDERGPFQGAYASLGTLNTEPDLPAVAAALHDRLAPGAPFVATVMNRRCWFEIMYNLRRAQPGKTLDRGGSWDESRAGASDVVAPVQFYTPDAFAGPFAQHFTVERVIAFPLLLPPVHMAEVYHARDKHFDRRLGRERRLREWPVLREAGDHFLIVLRHSAPAA